MKLIVKLFLLSILNIQYSFSASVVAAAAAAAPATAVPDEIKKAEGLVKIQVAIGSPTVTLTSIYFNASGAFIETIYIEPGQFSILQFPNYKIITPQQYGERMKKFDDEIENEFDREVVKRLAEKPGTYNLKNISLDITMKKSGSRLILQRLGKITNNGNYCSDSVNQSLMNNTLMISRESQGIKAEILPGLG